MIEEKHIEKIREVFVQAPRCRGVAVMETQNETAHKIASIAQDHCCIVTTRCESDHYIPALTPARLESLTLRFGAPDFLVLATSKVRDIFTVTRFLHDVSAIVFTDAGVAESLGLNRLDLYYYRCGPMAFIPVYGLGDKCSLLAAIQSEV